MRRLDIDDDATFESEEVKPRFALWVKEEKGREVGGLSRKRRRRYLKKFVKRWNSGDLAAHLYHKGGASAFPDG